MSENGYGHAHLRGPVYVQGHARENGHDHDCARVRVRVRAHAHARVSVNVSVSANDRRSFRPGGFLLHVSASANANGSSQSSAVKAHVYGLQD